LGKQIKNVPRRTDCCPLWNRILTPNIANVDVQVLRSPPIHNVAVSKFSLLLTFFVYGTYQIKWQKGDSGKSLLTYDSNRHHMTSRNDCFRAKVTSFKYTPTEMKMENATRGTVFPMAV
jgi:hypothetical protein